MISFVQKGDFKKTEKFFGRAINDNHMSEIRKCAKRGLAALRNATPVDTGKTAQSWDYKIIESNDGIKIEWVNNNIVDGVPIAVIIQTGHGTRNGGYVQGIDYINPALKPVFDDIVSDVWREVTRK